MPLTATEVSFYCALFCVILVCVRYNLEKRVFIYHCYMKKPHTNHAEENFALNFPTQHVHLEKRFPN